MASNTAETEFKRARRHTNAGKDRKRDLANKGTTKPFAIHTAEADANAPAMAKGSAPRS